MSCNWTHFSGLVRDSSLFGMCQTFYSEDNVSQTSSPLSSCFECETVFECKVNNWITYLKKIVHLRDYRIDLATWFSAQKSHLCTELYRQYKALKESKGHHDLPESVMTCQQENQELVAPEKVLKEPPCFANMLCCLSPDPESVRGGIIAPSSFKAKLA